MAHKLKHVLKGLFMKTEGCERGLSYIWVNMLTSTDIKIYHRRNTEKAYGSNICHHIPLGGNCGMLIIMSNQ